MDRYDADTAPDAAAWLALPQAERVALVAAHHPGPDALHLEPTNARMHAMLHAMVETQAASDDPPITGRTLERLTADGLRRHAAVHMIADVLLKWMASGQAFDPAAFEAQLRKLDPGTWLGDRMRRELGPGPT